MIHDPSTSDKYSDNLKSPSRPFFLKLSLLLGSRPKSARPSLLPKFGSHCSRFHPNRFTFGGVIAERVKTVFTPWSISNTGSTSLWSNTTVFSSGDSSVALPHLVDQTKLTHIYALLWARLLTCLFSDCIAMVVQTTVSKHWTEGNSTHWLHPGTSQLESSFLHPLLREGRTQRLHRLFVISTERRSQIHNRYM